MAKLIDGKAVSANVRTQVAEEVEALKRQGCHTGPGGGYCRGRPASRTCKQQEESLRTDRDLFRGVCPAGDYNAG